MIIRTGSTVFHHSVPLNKTHCLFKYVTDAGGTTERFVMTRQHSKRTVILPHRSLLHLADSQLEVLKSEVSLLHQVSLTLLLHHHL